MGTSSRALSSIQREVVDGLAGGGRIRHDALPDLVANRLTALLGRFRDGLIERLQGIAWPAEGQGSEP